jgi:WD40 repeat protein
MRLDLPRHDFQDVALDPERRWLAVANDNQLEFWQLKQETIRQTLNSPAEIVQDIRFSPSSDTLAAISTSGIRGSHHRTSLLLFASDTGQLLTQRRGGFDHLNWSAEYSQLAWSSTGQEILASSMFGSTIWRRSGDNQLDHAGFASLTGPARPVEFEFKKPAKKGKQTAKVQKIPHPRDPARTILQVKPQGQAIQLQCRLEAPVKITNQLATLAISLKIDADHSFRAPLTIQSSQLQTGPHQAPPWTWVETQDRFHLWTFTLPASVTEVNEFELHVQATAGVRSFAIERIDFVALGLPPDQKLASFATTQHIEHLSVAPSGERIWGCTAEEIHSWKWPSGEVASSWKNPNHRLTGAGNIRALQAGQKGTLVGTRDGRVHWLDPSLGTSLESWTGAGVEVVTLALCEEADLALVGSENGVVRGLSLPSGKTLFDLAADDSAILALAATPNGKVLVTASADRTLKIWERNAGSNSSYELFCALPETASLTRTLRLSADGKYLAALGRTTETAVLWNLPQLRAELQRLGIE